VISGELYQHRHNGLLFTPRKSLKIKADLLGPTVALLLLANGTGKGLTVNTGEMAGGKNFLIWMGLWIAALMVLLPALAGC